MPLTLDGTNGVLAVQAGAVESGDLPAGSVIQVVEGTSTNLDGTTSLSFVPTSLTASITPTSSTSQIVVSCSFLATTTVNNESAEFTVFRDGVNISTGVSDLAFFRDDGDTALMNQYVQKIDAPNTTLPVTYTLNILSRSGGNVEVVGTLSLSVIHLMEIAG